MVSTYLLCALTSPNTMTDSTDVSSSALQIKSGLPWNTVDRNDETKTRDTSRTRKPSRKSHLHFPSRGSLNSILESDDESDVEVGRSCNITDFYAPAHFTGIPLDFITSTPRPNPFVRPVSATTISSESCYSLSSAASLSSMITSGIFIPTVTAPSVNFSGRGVPANVANDRNVKADFGSTGLAERRGFKGAPLFTPKTVKKGSFPAVFSPRTPVSSPTSGFVTTMSSFWASSPKTSVPAEAFCFPQRIQDDYNQNNPFDTAAESYFVPHLKDNSYSQSDVQDNLYDFSVYHAIAEHKSDFFKSNSLRKSQTGVPSRSLNKFKSYARTNIYDMSIYDVCAQDSTKETSKLILPSAIAKPACKASPHTQWFPESVFVGSPKIWLTPPSAPSSPKRQAIKDDSPTIRRAEVVMPSRAVIPRSSNTRQSGVLPDAQRFTISRAPGLRPLILPLQVAKRSASPMSSPQSSPETTFADLATTPTPLSPQENFQLPIIESPLFGSPPVATESSTPAQCASTHPVSTPESRSANSSTERRSKAMVDILSLLDATALGAAEVLDAINCEEESVDVGEVSLAGLFEMIVHAV